MSTDNFRKYQIFISSTYTDLIDERRLIIEALLKMDFIPAGMEMFVASDTEQFKVITKVIDLCDYYLLIIGKCYGTINEETQISYTEMEYNYALSKGIPILVFALDENSSVSEDKKDTDSFKQSKLKAFREKAMKTRLATIWKNQTELALNVPIALSKLVKDFPSPGWVRVDSIENYQSQIIDTLQDKIAKTSESSSLTEFPKDMLKNAYPDLQNIDLAILEVIHNPENINMTYSKVADVLGFSIASIKHHIGKLIKMNLVRLEGTGKHSSLHTNFCSIISKFSFDYSNNNGEFTIGSGIYTFSTKWSKASDTSIHAYSDCNNITSIGRIKQVNNIKNISLSNINETDFSSRFRTANINDVIVWINENGKIALTKVIGIKDDSRNASSDQVECEYKIFFE